MGSTVDGIVYPSAGDFIAPLNAHLQTLAETTQDALDGKAPSVTTSYTPTFTGLTIGNGTVSAKWVKIGAVIFDEIVITFGSTTAVTGAVIAAGLQPGSSSTPTTAFVGQATLQDSGSGYYSGVVRNASTTSIEVYAQTSNGAYVSAAALTATIPHTWATSDKIIINTVRLAA